MTLKDVYLQKIHTCAGAKLPDKLVKAEVQHQGDQGISCDGHRANLIQRLAKASWRPMRDGHAVTQYLTHMGAERQRDEIVGGVVEFGPGRCDQIQDDGCRFFARFHHQTFAFPKIALKEKACAGPWRNGTRRREMAGDIENGLLQQ